MKKFLKSNIKLKTGLAFALAFMAFLFVQFLSKKNVENLRSSEEQMLNNRLFSIKVSIMCSSIESYQNKITGFILTGNNNFLVDYEKDLGEVSDNLKDILGFPAALEQKTLILRLDSLVGSDIKFYQKILSVYNRTNEGADAIALINTGKGIQLTNDIMNTATSIRLLDYQEFSTIINNNKTYSGKVVTIVYIAIALVALILLFSIFMLFSDMNKRTKVEKQLRIAQEKAVQSVIMKEQFMANMSHEIRTPMNAVLGFANLLSKSKLDDKQKEQLNAIQSSGENLLNIINDILDFSKIEEGMVKIEKIPFSPAALLHSINIMFLPKANEKKIQLDFQTESELPSTVMGDPTRLTQVLVNLINNALKFTNEGRIAVQTQLLPGKNSIQFTVKDTGIGIPKDKLDEIFDRFTQADTDTSRKYGGSGLGLFIVKKIIELQGGSISVESAEGLGSSFTFSIPYEKTDDAAYNTKSETPLPRIKAKMNILVAEDNILNQELARSLLSQWGFEFDMVSNGKIAIKYLKQKEYDLVLMDIQMPEMNGYNTAEYIRQELKLNMPIIAMTAHVLPGERDKCLSYGMTDYISKPIRENELYSLIAKYINKVPSEQIKETTNLSIINNNGHVTNLTYVKELFPESPDSVNKMIQLFLDQNPLEIQKLEEAISKHDMAEIQAIAHNMQSTVPFVGLNIVIGTQLHTIEDMAESELNLPQIEKLFAEVKEVCTRAVQELKN